MLSTTTAGLPDMTYGANPPLNGNIDNNMNGGMSNGVNLTGTIHDPLDMGTFQHPFVPQDLWKMPMTFEWDWADMTGYGGYEGGISMNGVLSDLAEDSNGQANGNGSGHNLNHG